MIENLCIEYLNGNNNNVYSLFEGSGLPRIPGLKDIFDEIVENIKKLIPSKGVDKMICTLVEQFNTNFSKNLDYFKNFYFPVDEAITIDENLEKYKNLLNGRKNISKQVKAYTAAFLSAIDFNGQLINAEDKTILNTLTDKLITGFTKIFHEKMVSHKNKYELGANSIIFIFIFIILIFLFVLYDTTTSKGANNHFYPYPLFNR